MPMKKALIVDDESVNCLLLEMALDGICEVQSVNSGEACLQALPTFNPDIVLLDINMPGMTGIEVCQKLKADNDTASIPVIFITALEGAEIRADAKEAGGALFMCKPIDTDELVEVVTATLAENS